MSRIARIEARDITLEYCDWTEYQLNHYYGPLYRTIYVAHTDDGFVGLEPVNGFLRVPEAPGLGLTLDRASSSAWRN